MADVLALATIVLLALGSCQSQPAPAAKARPSATAGPIAPVVLRAPDQAVLADADVRLVRISGRDHLSAAEAARDTSNEVLALEIYSGWGWVEASERTWSGGGQQVSETLLLTLRSEGAARAFDTWSRDAARAPFSATDCPASVHSLDQCRLGASGDQALVVGRLGAAVFRIQTTGLDAAGLAAKQAARIPA